MRSEVVRFSRIHKKTKKKKKTTNNNNNKKEEIVVAVVASGAVNAVHVNYFIPSINSLSVYTDQLLCLFVCHSVPAVGSCGRRN